MSGAILWLADWRRLNHWHAEVVGHLPLVNVTATNAVTYNHQLPLEWQPPQMLSLQFVASLHFAFVKTWHKRAGPFRLLTLEGNIQLLQQFYWEQHLFLFLCVIDIKLMHYLLLKLWYIPWKQWSELVVEKIVVIDVFAISQIIGIHVFFSSSAHKIWGFKRWWKN